MYAGIKCIVDRRMYSIVKPGFRKERDKDSDIGGNEIH